MEPTSCETDDSVEVVEASCLEPELQWEATSCEPAPRADFYQRLRSNIAQWLRAKGKHAPHSQLVLLAPDLFHLLTRLTFDSRVPTADKARLGVVLAYFIAPMDLLPEAVLGPAGCVDDVALAAFAIAGLINAGHGRIAEQLWAGDDALLKVIQRVVEGSQLALGGRALALLRSKFQPLS